MYDVYVEDAKDLGIPKRMAGWCSLIIVGFQHDIATRIERVDGILTAAKIIGGIVDA